MTPWEIDAMEIVNCNCAFGCPCQFNALPTYGNCEAVGGIIIHKGFHGEVRLDGLKAAFVAQWPGPIHMGNGAMQLVLDEAVTPPQRRALEAIFTGGDTDEMATVFWVFDKMTPNKLDTLIKPIVAAIDMDRRIGHVTVPGVFTMSAEPIRNPVTGDEHRARIDLPNGFEFRLAEVASGTTETMGELSLTRNHGTHAHICRLHMNGHGLIAQAA